MVEFTEEQRRLQKKVRAFVDEEVIPAAGRLDDEGTFPYPLFFRCCDLGFLDYPFIADGPDQSFPVEGTIVLEELSRGLGSLGLIFCPQFQGQSLLSYASDSLRMELAGSSRARQKIFSYALTERQSGTNAFDIATEAVFDGEAWTINGEKCWVTNAGVADGYFIVAKTAQGSSKRSISIFYIDSQDKGLIVGMTGKRMIGLSNSIMGTIRLEQCRIPSNRLIGGLNNGYPLMKLTLNQGRLQLGAVAAGIARRAMEMAMQYANSREQAGRRLSSLQAISFPIAEMYVHISALRCMLYQVAERFRRQQPTSVDASALKVFATEVCSDVCKNAMEIHGAYGLSKGADIERCLRDSFMLTAAEGTSQACKISIAGALNRPMNEALSFF